MVFVKLQDIKSWGFFLCLCGNMKDEILPTSYQMKKTLYQIKKVSTTITTPYFVSKKNVVILQCQKDGRREKKPEILEIRRSFLFAHICLTIIKVILLI